MNLSLIAFRELRRRPGRTLLTFLGIAVGVAAVVSVGLTTDATRRLYGDMYDTLTGKAALEVVADGYGGFDPAIATAVEEVAGVRAAVPLVQAPAALLAPGGTVPVFVLGVDPERESEVRELALAAGSFLENRDGMVLEEPFARAQGFDLGDSVRLLGSGGVIRAPLVGLLKPTGAGTFKGGSVVFLERSRAAELFGLGNRVNCLQVLTDEDVEARIRAVLPPGLRVQTPASRARLARDSLLSTEQGLASISIISLVASAFIILNTFHMNLAERRRQLAVLRALGATRRQVMRLLLFEALLLGGAGTLAGLLLGVLFAAGLTGLMSELLLMDLPATVVSPGPLAVGLVIGLATTLLATWWPAKRAGRREPLSDLAGHGRADAAPPKRIAAWVGVGLLALCALLVAGLLLGALPVDLVTPGMALCLVGSVLTLPLLLTPLLALARRLLVPLLGIEGSLGLRVLDRHRRRTALTAGVLFVAIVANVGSGSSIRGSMSDLHDYFERSMVADYFVRSAMPELGLMTAASLPEDLATQLSELPGVAGVEKLRFLPAFVNDRPVLVIAQTLDPNAPLHFDLYQTEPDAAQSALRRGEAIAATGLLQRLGVAVGDTFTLATPNGPRPVKIGGAITDYTAGGVVIHLEWGAARELLGLAGADVLLVRANAAERAAVAGPLAGFCRERGLLLQSNADLRAKIDQMVAGLIASDWVMLAMVFLVASLGIVNTLIMNVLEQTRELGTLRAIGLKRGQVRRVILSQALGLGVVSVVPGVLFGALLAYFMNLATLPLLGHPVEFRLDWALIATCAGVAIMVALAAGFFPARRAARLEISGALMYE